MVWWLPSTTVASAIIITYFVICPSSLGSRLVGLGFLVFIGDLSYTVYLIHFPVYLAIEQDRRVGVLAQRARPAGGHLRHRHRQLVPHRAAPDAVAPALGGQVTRRRPHLRRRRTPPRRWAGWTVPRPGAVPHR